MDINKKKIISKTLSVLSMVFFISAAIDLIKLIVLLIKNHKQEV